MTPDRRHLIVELDEPYSRRELAVLLAAFRSRLLGAEPDAENLGVTACDYAASTAKTLCGTEDADGLDRVGGFDRVDGFDRAADGRVDQIVGPGFVIEMLGCQEKTLPLKSLKRTRAAKR